MKTKFTLLIALVIAAFGANAQANQIPNGGFENWTTTLNPDGWATYDSLYGMSFGFVSKDGVDKAVGNFSVKIVSDSVPTQGTTVRPGIVSLGSAAIVSNIPNFYGIPFTFRPDTIFFGYEYDPFGLDTAVMQIYLARNDSTVMGGVLPLDSSGWVLLYATLAPIYVMGGNPDELGIAFLSSNRAPKYHSTLHVDAMRFGYVSVPTFIDEINSNLTVSLFPNPAKDVVNIRLNEVQNNTTIMVYDMAGRVFTHEFLNGDTHQLNTASWPSGMYLYAVISGDGKATNRGRFTITK